MLGRVLLRCGAPTIIRPVTRTVVLPIRTYATPGRPKSVVGEPSRPVKRAVKKAAAKPADGSSPAEKNVAAKAKSKKKAPKKLTEEEKTALKERQAKVKARRQVVIEKEKLQALKKAALEPPKVERDNPYAAFTKEKNKTLGPITRQSDETAAKAFADRISAIGAEWKSMGAADREHWNHVCRTAAESSQAEYKRWVESHSAEEIRLANLARKQLEKKEGPKEKRAGKKWPLIKDERAVTRPATPFILFAVNRHASGDFKHIAVTERLRLISREWKELSESEKEKYQQIAAQDSARYQEEYRDIYKHAPPSPKPAAVAATA